MAEYIHFCANQQFALGAILLLGLLVGQFTKSTDIFPKITGYLLFGLIFGPNCLNIITASVLNDIKPFTDFAVALCALSIGLQFNLNFLIRHKLILLTSIVEILTTFVLVYVSLIFLHVEQIYALLISVISVTSLPMMSRLHCQAEEKEFYTKKSLAMAAMNNLVAFVAFMLVIPFASQKNNATLLDSFLFVITSVYKLIGPFILVFCIATIAIKIMSYIKRSEKNHFTLLIATVLMSMGAARMLGMSGIISSLLLGAALVNLDKDNKLLKVELGYGSELFNILLFVMTGASLYIHQVISVGAIATVLVMVRFAGKLLPTILLAKKIGITNYQSYILSLTLYPMAGTAISLINLAKDYSANFDIVVSIVLAAITIIELTAPLLNRFTIKKPDLLQGAELLIHR